MKRIIYIIFALLAIVIMLTYLLSPFKANDQYKYPAIISSVEIKAPIESVYANSSHASQWSVYVHHITKLNSNEFADGQVGCRRRCFQQADEQGIVWDELITEVVPQQKRQLILYNLKGFSMTAEGLATEQLYTKINDSATKLSLTLFYKDGNPSAIDHMKTYIAAYFINNIFSRNLANIKKNCEEL